LHLSELKKILVCEFITGGGLSGAPLPQSLAHEGVLMRDALLRDINELAQYEVTVMHDARLIPSQFAVHSLVVQGAEFLNVFNKAINETDLIWLIAPETNAALIELTELCLASEALLSESSKSDEHETIPKHIGCGYEATLIGTSKTLAFEALKKANIHTLPVFAGDELMQASVLQQMLKLNTQKWIAKPEDGAGCEGIRYFDSIDAMRDWLKLDDQYLNYLAQPYQNGVNASFSFLCDGSQAWLLSANRQHITLEGQAFKLTGITVNGMLPYWQRFETLMRKLVKMLPDALGYVGVDVIIDPVTDHIYVIDINPRLTSSYIGMSRAIGHNAAKIILDCILDPHFKMPVLQKNVVEITF